jgi:large subunit ribosomal protein L18
MKKKTQVLQRKNRRAHRVRVHIGKGTASVPRLSVFRSNTAMYAQIINDEVGKTLCAVKATDIKTKGKKADIAREVGKLIAEKAKKAGITKVIFDRGGYQYHGRVKALADGAREGGLIF